jgi:hypothetical protein
VKCSAMKSPQCPLSSFTRRLDHEELGPWIAFPLGACFLRVEEMFSCIWGSTFGRPEGVSGCLAGSINDLLEDVVAERTKVVLEGHVRWSEGCLDVERCACGCLVQRSNPLAPGHVVEAINVDDVVRRWQLFVAAGRAYSLDHRWRLVAARPVAFGADRFALLSSSRASDRTTRTWRTVRIAPRCGRSPRLRPTRASFPGQPRSSVDCAPAQ